MSSPRLRALALFALAIVALVAFGAWWLSRPAGELGQAMASADARARSAASAEQASIDGAAPRTAIEDVAIATQRSSGPRIRLVDAHTGAALPGASLRCDEYPHWGGIDRTNADLQLERATVLTADESGIVQLPLLAEGFAVAHTRELWGYAQWRKGAIAPEEIRLEPDVELRVQCVDESGAPVFGVPVGLHLRGSIESDRTRLARAPDGIARFHVRELLEARRDTADASLRASVACGLLSVELHAVALSADELVGALHMLRIPPRGSVDVDVVDLDGRPVADGFEVALRTEDSLEHSSWSDDTSNEDLSRMVSRHHDEWDFEPPEVSALERARLAGLVVRVSGRTRGGRVSFDVVAGAHALRAELRRRGVTAESSAVSSAMESFTAPRSGERVRVELALGRHSLVLRGRALDPDGAPRAFARIAAMTTASSLPTSAAWTDRDGRFDVELERAERAERDRAWLTLPEGGCAAYAVDLPSGARSGVVELGDVRFAVAAPHTLRGTVVLSDGTPAQDAIVELSRRGEPFEQKRVVDAAGVFAFATYAEWGLVELQARSTTGASATLALDIGDPAARESEVTLHLKRFGTVVGRIELPSGARPDEFELEVAAREVVLAEDGSFESRPLEPGSGYLELRVADGDGALVQLEVDVALEARNLDRRLNPLRVAELVRLVELDIVDERGAPVRHATVEFESRDPDGSAADTEAANGHARQWLPRGEYDAVVDAAGFAPVLVTNVRGGERVVLKPALVVVLELAAAPASKDVSDDDLYLGLYGSDAHTRCIVWSDVGENRRASFEVSGPGRYRVLCCAGYPPRDEDGENRALAACPLEIAIDAESAREPIAIHTQEAWWVENRFPIEARWASGPASRPARR